MDQRLIDLYDRYTHGAIDRRTFLGRAAALTGSTVAASALLAALTNDYARAATVPENDPRLALDDIAYESPKGRIAAYLARPKSKGKRPAVVVIHENRGLTPHVRDVARRLGVEGFLALAPDLLSLVGGAPADEDKGRALHAGANKDDMLAAAIAAVAFAKAHPESSGKAGAVGFCYGGGVVNRLAIESAELDAAVPYYGPVPPDLAQVAKIKAPLLLQYAGTDAGINGRIHEYEAALKAAGKRYTIHMYEGAQHAFNNDTAGPRYDKAAADLAWSRTLAFFREHLGAPPNAA